MIEMIVNFWDGICYLIAGIMALATFGFLVCFSTALVWWVMQDIFWFFGYNLFFKRKIYLKKKEGCKKCDNLFQRECKKYEPEDGCDE